jgi:hypothetical protein
MSWIWLIVALLIGYIGGYISKDQLTDEYKSEIDIRKIKVKGEGSRMDLDLDQLMEIKHTRLTWKQRRDARKKKKSETS